VFLLSLDPLGLNTYLPVMASMIPSPPEVPGSHADTTDVDSLRTLSISIGRPAARIVIKGMFLSSYLMWVITSLSNFSKSKAKVYLCFVGRYG